MRRMASHDNEVYSSDVFRILADYEISRSTRYPNPLGLLEIEMTPSTSNEEALRAAYTVFISALNGHLRSVDITSAAGGNRFRILLPSTNSAGTETVCERLLSIFRNKLMRFGSVAFHFRSEPPVTMAAHPSHRRNSFKTPKLRSNNPSSKVQTLVFDLINILLLQKLRRTKCLFIIHSAALFPQTPYAIQRTRWQTVPQGRG